MIKQNTYKQKSHFLIVSKSQQTKIISDINQASRQSECIKFQDPNQISLPSPNQSLFIDHSFSITDDDIDRLQGQFKQKIILKRICRLYPQKHQPLLFPNSSSKVHLPRKAQIPHFIYELAMFDMSVFKRNIIQKDLSQNGKYQILINRYGKYQLQVIDDIVPVFKKNEEPIWGQYLTQPWQLVLLKIWAKIQKGYSVLNQVNSFIFYYFFIQPNWKQFNLGYDGVYFINFYKNKIGNHTKILLKSKNSQKIVDFGLIPGRICYQLLEIQVGKNEMITLLIRTGFLHAWTGEQSIFDQSFKITQKMRQKFKLNYTFTLSLKDFLNIFSLAYVTHTNLQYPIYRSFCEFRNSHGLKTARHFQITFQREGFFSFSIIQPELSMVGESRIEQRKLQDSNKTKIAKRYLSLKYILSRKIEGSKNYLQGSNQISRIRSTIRQSRIKFAQKYNEIGFDIYEIGHTFGYSKQNGHFLQIIPGTYILRVKGESSVYESNFVISYSTHEIAEMRQVYLNKQQSANFLSESIISSSDKMAGQSLSNQKYQKYSIIDQTDTLGYAFMVMKVSKKCPYKVLIEVDPTILNEEGYKLKEEYKHYQNKFQVQLGKGESKAIIFKRIPKRNNYVWPSKGFKVKTTKQGKDKEELI